MRKPTTRHKPPSRIRYEQSHPVVSCRIPKADYDLLKQRLKELNISFATFVKDALGRLEIKLSDIEEARNEGYNKGYKLGYNKAMKDYQIWYHCSVCGERMNMKPNDEDHKEMIHYMREHGWRHAKCPEKQKR